MTGTRDFEYPHARRQDLTEDLFGHQVTDPYRWMEDPDSSERADFLAAQDLLYAAERAEWPGRDQFAARVRELLNALSAPCRSALRRRSSGSGIFLSQLLCMLS